MTEVGFDSPEVVGQPDSAGPAIEVVGVGEGTATARESPAKRLTPSRTLRIILGTLGAVLILLLLLNWLLLPVLVPKTTESIVNAPIVGVRSEVDGTVQVILRVGDPVRPGQVLAHSANSYLDQAPELRLQTEKASLEAELVALHSDLETAKQLRDRAGSELRKYRDGLVRELTLSKEQASGKTAELSTALERAKRLNDLSEKLVNTGVAPRQDGISAQEELRQAEARLKQAEKEQATIENELDNAVRKVFLQRDTPIYLTLYMQFEQSVASIEHQVIETRKRLVAVTSELSRWQTYKSTLARGTVTAPVLGEVWRINPSSSTVRGETLVEIAESQNVFVEAHFQEGFAAQLSPDARAIIQVSGEPALWGTVRALRQTSPTDLDSALAIRFPRRLNQINAFIDLDRPAEVSHLLGHQCRVLVVRQSHATTPLLLRPVQWLAAWLFLALGW